MSTHKAQSKKALKAQPYIASLIDHIKKDSTTSPSTSTSTASVNHRAAATSPGSESDSSTTLSSASLATYEKRRDTAAALPRPVESYEPAACLKYGSHDHDEAVPCATSTVSPCESGKHTSPSSSRPLDKCLSGTTARSRPLGSQQKPQMSLDYGTSDSDCATPRTTASPREYYRSTSIDPDNIHDKDREATGALRCSSPSEDGECSPPHSRRSSTPAGDFYRPAATPPHGGFGYRYIDDVSGRPAYYSKVVEPQRRKADTYRPHQDSQVERQRGAQIGQQVTQNLTADLHQLQSRKVNRPKKIQRGPKGRPILAKYIEKRDIHNEAREELFNSVPKEALKRDSTQVVTKTKKLKKVKDEGDHRRDSGSSMSKSPASLSDSSTDGKASGNSEQGASSRTDADATEKLAQGKKRTHSSKDLDQDEDKKVLKKPKLSKTEIVQEVKKTSSPTADNPNGVDSITSERKKVIPKKLAPSKSKTPAEVVEDAVQSPVTKVSRKRKSDEDEDSSSAEDAPVNQLRPYKKQKVKEPTISKKHSDYSGESSPKEPDQVESKSKAASKATTAKKPRGIPAEERVRGVAYKKCRDGTWLKQERKSKMGAAKPKVKPKPATSKFIKG